MITAAPEAHMAMVVLTRLHLLMLEQAARLDVEPAGTRFHQLIAGDGEAIYVAAAPQQTSGYQECASAGMAATNAATISIGETRSVWPD